MRVLVAGVAVAVLGLVGCSDENSCQAELEIRKGLFELILDDEGRDRRIIGRAVDDALASGCSPEQVEETIWEIVYLSDTRTRMLNYLKRKTRERATAPTHPEGVGVTGAVA